MMNIMHFISSITYMYDIGVLNQRLRYIFISRVILIMRILYNHVEDHAMTQCKHVLLSRILLVWLAGPLVCSLARIHPYIHLYYSCPPRSLDRTGCVKIVTFQNERTELISSFNRPTDRSSERASFLLHSSGEEP